MTAPGELLTIKDTARKTVGWYADYVSNPTKLSLHKHQFQRFTARSAPNFSVSDFVPPAKSKNALQT